MVERGGAQTDEHLARTGLGIGRFLVAQDLGPAVLVDPNRLHPGTISHMQAEELARLGEELGLDAVGAAAAAPYRETERHILERRARGLFADMRFTMARPEVSCHPEKLLEGARTVVSAALCYWLEGEEPPPGHGRLPRYTWWDAYAALRERLDELGRRLGGEYRVLVDANQHVDREAAARSGVGFYGKNTMLITRRHGSWVVLGTLVTAAELEATPPLDAGCGSCTLCIDACPTDALEEAGVLDATRCLSYWTQSADPMPEEIREALGDRVYGCDICQDVCPWNRGVEKRRAGGQPPVDAEPHVSLVEWLELSDEELRTRYERLYFPRKDPRYLRRNALVALGNSGDPELRPIAETYAAGEDPLLREHAEWALARLDENPVET
jgi:epoxyqueuosine reductase